MPEGFKLTDVSGVNVTDICSQKEKEFCPPSRGRSTKEERLEFERYIQPKANVNKLIVWSTYSESNMQPDTRSSKGLQWLSHNCVLVGQLLRIQDDIVRR